MRRLALFFFLLVAITAHAQTDSLHYYLQDDGLSSRKYIFKMDAVSVFHGELSFFLERVLSKNTSLEAGISILLPYYHHDLLPLLVNGKPTFANNTTGVDIWLAGRRYFEKAPERMYMEISGHQRRFSTLTLTDMSLGTGKQLVAGRRFTIDGALGVGLRFQKSRREGVYLFDPDYLFVPIVPLHIKFGYLL